MESRRCLEYRPVDLTPSEDFLEKKEGCGNRMIAKDEQVCCEYCLGGKGDTCYKLLWIVVCLALRTRPLVESLLTSGVRQLTIVVGMQDI